MILFSIPCIFVLVTWPWTRACIMFSGAFGSLFIVPTHKHHSVSLFCFCKPKVIIHWLFARELFVGSRPVPHFLKAAEFRRGTPGWGNWQKQLSNCYFVELWCLVSVVGQLCISAVMLWNYLLDFRRLNTLTRLGVMQGEPCCYFWGPCVSGGHTTCFAGPRPGEALAKFVENLLP